MKYNLVSSWLLIMLLFLSCNSSIENSTNSKPSSENLIAELIDIEEKLTQVNPNNTGEVLKISNQIESLAMKLFTQNRNDLDTVSLEFVFEKDPNLFLRKNKIVIRGSFEVDKGYTVDNGFAAKLFSMMSVEIDSQTISKSFNR